MIINIFINGFGVWMALNLLIYENFEINIKKKTIVYSTTLYFIYKSLKNN
jgi:hypothetical protein